MFCIWVLLLWCNCWIVMSINKVQGKDEEIVQYTLQKYFITDTGGTKSVRRLVFEFPWRGSNISIDLHPSRNLIADDGLSNYGQTRRQHEFDYFCTYEGEIIGVPSSVAGFSVCDGNSGMFFIGMSTYVFEIDGNKILADEGMLKILPLGITKKCKEEKPSVNLNRKADVKSELQNIDVHGSYVSGWKRYIEVIIVADYELNLQFAGDERAIMLRCVSIINYVNMIMKPLDIFVVLVGVEIIDRKETLTMSTDHEKMLTNYQIYRPTLLAAGKKHDYTLFLSGTDLHGETVGYARIGTMCSKLSVAVVQHHPKSVRVEEVATIIGHELGHSLGAKHDALYCKPSTNSSHDSCVMTGDPIKNSCWSNCSKIYIVHNIDRFRCLLNVPKMIKIGPSCGNGIIERGEQCDCGIHCDQNTCCDGSTCKLTPHSVCATGPCCNLKTCKPYQAGKLCRKSVSECDLPEYCSGSVEFCPADVYKHDGLPCHSSKGLCYHGKCGSYELWCENFMIPSGKEPEQRYLDEIDSKTNPLHVCSKIYCQPHLTVDASSNANQIFNNRDFYPLARGPLIEFPHVKTDGLTCGRNQTCINKNCQPIPLMKDEVCALGCSGHGICNSEGNCHCDPGYAPPDCITHGFGGSINSGHVNNPADQPNYATRILWITLACIPPFAILCCIWTNIKLVWDSNCKQACLQHYPIGYKFIEDICCPCMLFLNRWLCTMGYDALQPKENYCDDHEDAKEVRMTICTVDKDIKLPDAEVRTWGVASDVLFTDLITITPKNSPRTTRKIRLPSDSPILKSKSMENLTEVKSKPKYMKSISKDSGNVSDMDDNRDQQQPKLKSSMSSLISALTKYGQQKPAADEEKDADKGSPKKSLPAASKHENLRRMVVDPLFNQKNAAASDSPLTRPNLRRSLSHDVTSQNRVLKSHAILPPSSPLGQNQHTNLAPIHGSEQHLHFISEKIATSNVSECEEENISSPSGRISETTFEINKQQTKALLPPRKKMLN